MKNASKACILFILLIVTSELHPKSFPARGFAKILTPAKAQENLNEFRSLIASSFQESSFHSAYCFNFKFRHMPRRGAETECFGSIAGPTLGSGVFRIEIFPDPVISEQKVFLIRNPLEPRAWVGHQNQNIPKVLSHNALLQPMISGMNQTLFDFLCLLSFGRESI